MRGVGLAVTRDDEPLEERRRKQDVQLDRIEKALQYAHQSEALSGMVSTRTLWGAVGAIAGVASVIVALVVGIT